MPGFLNLLLSILQHPSLTVSIPILYIWPKLLSTPALIKSGLFSSIIGPLLEICTSRLLRYESMPSETDDATFLFLHEDFDTMPERHAFVGNYRRLCTDTIEKIVRRSPFEAVRHLLTQADHVLSTLYGASRPFTCKITPPLSSWWVRVLYKSAIRSTSVQGILNNLSRVSQTKVWTILTVTSSEIYKQFHRDPTCRCTMCSGDNSSQKLHQVGYIPAGEGHISGLVFRFFT